MEDGKLASNNGQSFYVSLFAVVNTPEGISQKKNNNNNCKNQHPKNGKKVFQKADCQNNSLAKIQNVGLKYLICNVIRCKNNLCGEKNKVFCDDQTGIQTLY